MADFIQKGRDMLEKNEKIIQEIIVQRVIKSLSTIILLTNKRIIYFSWVLGFKAINLSEISAITYLPKPFHSAGLLKIITKKGKNILISPSYVNQIEANEFIKEIKTRLK